MTVEMARNLPAKASNPSTRHHRHRMVCWGEFRKEEMMIVAVDVADGICIDFGR